MGASLLGAGLLGASDAPLQAQSLQAKIGKRQGKRIIDTHVHQWKLPRDAAPMNDSATFPSGSVPWMGVDRLTADYDARVGGPAVDKLVLIESSVGVPASKIIQSNLWMLQTAATLGYAYYAVTDHAPDLAMQRMTEAKMLAQRKKLDALQSKYPKLTLLHGSELNIAPDGHVDWGPEFLSKLDVTVASVHGVFNQSKDEMTKRIVTAMENPYVNVIGHPTARLIGRREPIDFDFEEVFKAAARTGTAMEINCHPDRLDLRDEHILWARRHGVKFAVDTDAHSIPDLDNLHFGVATAQRGWLTKDDVINTWPLAKLKRFLAKSR
jgi:histidinol phosphatase-like PHP family hydrolase